MSVTFDAVATASVATGNSTTLSWTHTAGAGATAVGVFLFNYEHGATVTGVTYGGLTLAQNNNVSVPDVGSNNSSLQAWGLASGTLPTGAQTVVVTVSINLASNVYIDAFSHTVTGSDTGTCFRTSNSNVLAYTAGSVSTTLASALSGDLVVDISGCNGGASSATAGGSQTVKGTLNVGGNRAYSSIQSATGSTTMSWTWSGASSNKIAVVAVAFKLPTPPSPILFGPRRYPSWSTQLPKINRAHPLAKDLLFYGYDCGGYYVNLCGSPNIYNGTAGNGYGPIGTPYSSAGETASGALPKIMTPFGPAVNWTNQAFIAGNGPAAWADCGNGGGGSGAGANMALINNANQLHSYGTGAGNTFASGFMHRGETPTSTQGIGNELGGWVFGRPLAAAEAGACYNWALFKETSTTNTFLCRTLDYAAGSGASVLVGSTTVPTNTYTTLGCTTQNTSSGSGTSILYNQGQSVATSSAIAMALINSNGEDQIEFGGVFHVGTGNTGQMLDGQIFWGGWWGRPLSASEHQQLAYDPYCFLIFGDTFNPISLPSTGSVGSASGIGAAAGVGASIAASVFSASGTGLALGIGAATSASVFSSSGVGLATGIGAGTDAAVGSSSGTGSSTFVGASSALSIGSSTGVGLALGVAPGVNSSEGDATGIGTATGIGAAIFNAIASATGTGLATGFAPSVTTAIGSAFGIGTARGISPNLQTVVGGWSGGRVEEETIHARPWREGMKQLSHHFAAVALGTKGGIASGKARRGG